MPVSVDKAIKRGLYTVNLPALLIFLIGLIGSFILAFVFFEPYGMIIGLVCSYILATTYRTIMAAKWRIWAFCSVRNVHELYARDVSEKLLHLTNKPAFGVINYNTESQQKQWQELQVKFTHQDIFIDDPSVPAQTMIRYSLLKKALWAVFFLLMVIFGSYMCTLGHIMSYILSAILFVIGAINAYMMVRHLFDRKPQITINNAGIATQESPFYKWDEITNERVIREGSGKYAMYYLCYDHQSGSVKFHLDGLDASFRLLEKLLRVYRARYEEVFETRNKFPKLQ